MLEGVRSGPIIAGAYTSPEGTCPMLAAHRRGGRTSLDTFARAWDSYTGAQGARLATDRELRTLQSMLEISLGAEEAPSSGDLGRAIAEHREVRDREVRRAVDAEHRAEVPRRAASGDPDRTSELRGRPGWAWLRVFRRLDEYEAAVAQAQAEEAGVAEPERSLVGASAEN